MVIAWLARGLLVLAVIYVFSEASSCNPSFPGLYGHDKLLHIGAFYGLALLGDIAFPAARYRAAVISGLAAFGAAIEIQQYMLPWRCFSFYDLLADFAGIGLYYLSLLFPFPGRMLSWLKRREGE